MVTGTCLRRRVSLRDLKRKTMQQKILEITQSQVILTSPTSRMLVNQAKSGKSVYRSEYFIRLTNMMSSCLFVTLQLGCKTVNREQQQQQPVDKLVSFSGNHRSHLRTSENSCKTVFVFMWYI